MSAANIIRKIRVEEEKSGASPHRRRMTLLKQNLRPEWQAVFKATCVINPPKTLARFARKRDRKQGTEEYWGEKIETFGGIYKAFKFVDFD